jgi:hypothetical protein
MTQNGGAGGGNPSSASSGRSGRNRGRKRITNKRGKGQQVGGGSSKKSSSSSSTPPPPQLKITIRNIQNSSKFGSVKAVLQDLIQKLMDTCVEKKANNQYVIEMDRSVVRCLIEEEEKINEYKAREKATQEDATKTGQNESDDDKAADDDQVTQIVGDDSETGESNAHTMALEGDSLEVQSKDDGLEVIVPTKLPSSLPAISARPLYVIPPRRTRRRGERAGTAYILLTAPMVEDMTMSSTDDQSVKKQADNRPPHDVVAKETLSMEITQTPTSVTPQHEPSIESNVVEKAAAATAQIVDFPRKLARGRLLLLNAVHSLSEVAGEDFKTQEFFSGCIVEQSMNAKSWKMHTGRPDRREGTIEATADYKKWLQTLTKQKEELKARPKPAPGGGSPSTTTAGENQDNGQPVAALVQHLRAKKQDMQRKKSTKKKDDGRNKSKKDPARPERKKTRRKDDSKKETAGKKPKKKKRPPRGTKARAKKSGSTTVAPTAVLKPPSTAS